MVLASHVRENLVRVVYTAVGLPQEIQRLNRQLHITIRRGKRHKAGTFLSTLRATTE
jgi:hypothetical protein